MSTFRELLRAGCCPFMEVEDAVADTLERHYDLLARWNRKLNLTALRTIEEAVAHHYVESLFVGLQIQRAGAAQSIVDVGSGAGFPGFPVAALNSTSTVTLVESHQRKAVFLRESARLLPNIQVAAGRFEATPGTWDLMTSRAVAWADISRHAVCVARSLALLVGPSDVETVIANGGVSWDAPLPLPSPRRGFLVLGTVR